MNTSHVRSLKRTPYEVVFGQKANGANNLGICISQVQESDVADIIQNPPVENNSD